MSKAYICISIVDGKVISMDVYSCAAWQLTSCDGIHHAQVLDAFDGDSYHEAAESAKRFIEQSQLRRLYGLKSKEQGDG